MFVDQLTEPMSSQLAAAVLAVLSGQSRETAAAEHGVPVAGLDDAVQAYRAAGQAALERLVQRRWNQVLVEFPDWEQAETIAATQLAARMDRLHRDETIGDWWFLRKHPCWRLRIRTPSLIDPRSAELLVTEMLTELTATRVIAGWRNSPYEPEHAAFGGPTAMAIAHDLFCADSHGVLDYVRAPTPRIGRRELSIMLLHALLRGAELDWFERGDVFYRVAQLRPAPQASTHTDAMETLTHDVRTLISASAHADNPLFDQSGPAASAAAWHHAFHTAGRRLADAAHGGRLDRGLRALLTHVVIFHWNRLGLSATTQGVLARAATAAFLP
ncbi:MAG TPA: thiopeptide-type bacteriocin biosynthesis protein [Spirillospora sp.]|nr:thiopeptide-type bacteriocin biosynthesis protein [Spirillospora sp.]